jgi:hypothetical protein
MGGKKFHAQGRQSPDDHYVDQDQDKPPWVRRYLELADLLIKPAQRRLGYAHVTSKEHCNEAA